jgi:tetratricopeptide (TPR) repeat protein
LGWIPLVLAMRRYRRRAVRVYSADEMEIAEQPVAEPAEQMETPVEAAAAMEAEEAVESRPAPTAVPPPMAPIYAQAPVVQPIPVEMEPVGAAAALSRSVRRSSPPPSREITRDGKIIDAGLQKGNQFAMEEKYEEALRQYRTVLTLQPDSQDAIMGLAYVAFAQGQWELSGDYYRRALNFNPDSADAHYGLGRCLLESGQTEEAIPELQTALSLDPTLQDARDTLTTLGRTA